MRFSPPLSKEGKGSSNQASPRVKRLDAICEKEFKRHHGDSNEGEGRVVGTEDGDDEPGMRRSTRVRRAPVLLDVSPPPRKKRKKIVKDVRNSPVLRGSEDLDDASMVWNSRLRTRRRGLSFGVRDEEEESPRGKRKISVEELRREKWEKRVEEKEMCGENGEMEVGTYTVMRSKRPGRVKTRIRAKTDAKVIDSLGVKDDDMLVEELETEVELKLDDDLDGSIEKERVDGDKVVTVEQEENSEANEPLQKDVEEPKNGENKSDEAELVERQEEPPEKDEIEVMDEMEACNSGRSDAKEADEPVEEQKVKDDDVKVENLKSATREEPLGKSRIKVGRRCGLCGGGADGGKPPKPLAQDTAESENEVYSGSSGSEEPNYDIWDGFGDEPSWLGRLLGPINDRYGIAGTWVHQLCAVWSPEVYFAGLGCLKNIRAALFRGRVLKCTRCGRPGATIGCRVDRCPKTYHLPCARANGCIFNHRKFLIACTDHRHIFQPHGAKLLARIKKVKAKKMKLQYRKLTIEASRKDIEAEEKWFENCGEDEEFLKRESKRLNRDLARIAPVYIGGTESENGKLFKGWESVAGLQDVIQCMKEVVILPLLYPEFFDNLGLTPPRGVLLHGYPGTGKTLVVRALIGACARGNKRIAYFARKGADCLGKYVGDAERQLRLLFQVAEKCQPSIIFFDEIDGLAPCRTRRQDQTHSSVVSTLLALMDGLKSRGSVIVIGATNRPDAIDPALRRPGRFDREVYFPLPTLKDRAAILSLHTQKWPKPVAGPLLEWVAGQTAGFAGADLQALCTQVAMIGLKRNFPLQGILSEAEKRGSSGKRLPLPNFAVEEGDWLEALSQAPPPCSRREAGIAANDVVSSSLPVHLTPCLLHPLVTLLVSLHLDERVSFPGPLSKAAATIETVMVSALTKKRLQSHHCHWWSFLDDFLREGDVAREIEKGLSNSGLLLGDYSIAISDDSNEDGILKFKPPTKRNGMNLMQPRNESGFRVLIAGSPGSGQRHLASCLVHCFVGNAGIQKLDLATILQEGHGDAVLGITERLMKCGGMSSNMLFMPRIDLWAMDAPQQATVEESDSVSTDDPQCSEKKGNSGIRHNHAVENKNAPTSHKRKQEERHEQNHDVAARRASSAWSLFVEQVESICVSTPLTILATSEVSDLVLPIEIRQFFAKQTLNSALLPLAEHTIPRFVVRLDGDFDRDSVIDLSATKLSKDVVQLLFQLLHQRSHSRKTLSSDDSRVSDFIEDNTYEVETHGNEEPALKTLQPLSNTRMSKGRSSLHLAIASFGYQVLRYPHFAELCWVTSKLNEGPSAKVNGPWKGWPFNSCIIRPANMLEKIIVGPRSGNVKSKEKSGLVRGLIAVGLSAYKGVYTSLREVSFEVRKVLNLLASLIDEKVQAGKDRYQYLRILSQVRYLEDKVDSWVYSLRSLELDSLAIVENSKMINGDSAQDNQVQSKEVKPCVSSKLDESEVLERNPQGLGARKVLCIDLNQEDCVMSQLSPEVSLKIHNPVDNSEKDNQLGRKISIQQNGLLPNGNNTPVDDGVSGILEHSNGFTSTSPIPGFEETRLVFDKNGKDAIFTSSKATNKDDVCLYSCCPECLNTLIDLAKKAIVRRCSLASSNWTVDGVHDVVALLSVDLLSTVRKVYASGDIASPVDCNCHSKRPNTTSKADSWATNITQTPFAMKFLFRNGVMIRLDADSEVSFHCRFETLCLCSIIDSIRAIDHQSPD